MREWRIKSHSVVTFTLSLQSACKVVCYFSYSRTHSWSVGQRGLMNKGYFCKVFYQGHWPGDEEEKEKISKKKPAAGKSTFRKVLGKTEA